MPDNATWTYSVSGGGSDVRTVVGSKIFNGASVRIVRDLTGSEIYFTNDAAGVRFHGAFFVDPAGNETDTYSPPVVEAAREAFISTPVYSSGTVYADLHDGNPPVTVGYNSVSTPLGFETVAVPAGTFANALHVRLTLEYIGYYSVTLDEWLVPGIGSVKETSYDTFTNLTATWELVSYSVPDTIPDPFAFPPKTVDASNLAVESDPITVSGISSATPISINGGGDYRINAGAFTGTPGTVNNGDQVMVRVYSPLPGNSAGATLDIGGETATFTVTTRADTAPDPFSFTPVIGAPLGIAIMSNRITITGINAPAPISIVGGEYSASGQPFTSASATVCKFCSVEVRVASAATHGATTSATVTIGGVNAVFSVTTFAPGQGPSSMLFFRSQPGDYIGGGRTRLINFGAAYPEHSLQVLGNSGTVNIRVNEPSQYFLDLDAPGTGALVPGRYEGAVRFPFNGDAAGVSFTGNGAACNTVTGRFDVLEVAYAADGSVQRLAANFEQHCEGAPPALFGEMRVNSMVPLGSNAIRRTRADFNGDGRSDILWRNVSSGENYLYPMDGRTILATEGSVRTVADQNWQVAGVGDFDGDGKADILWRHSSTGENYLYFMDGTTIKPTEGYIRSVPDQNWQVAGVGDFDGDGKDDILWRNAVTGENYLYLMDGKTIKPGEGYLRAAGIAWQVVGVGDFDGDGKADILWRNSSSGQNYVYPMDGKAIKPGEGFIRTVADLAWQVSGVGDFDGDGKADILWRNGSTGENYLYPMNGTAILASEGYLRTVTELSWRIVGVGDYDGDGRSDILWRNSSSGENYLYPMDGRSVKPTEGTLRMVADQNWKPQ